jgi:hypothetical protein
VSDLDDQPPGSCQSSMMHSNTQPTSKTCMMEKNPHKVQMAMCMHACMHACKMLVNKHTHTHTHTIASKTHIQACIMITKQVSVDVESTMQNLDEH